MINSVFIVEDDADDQDFLTEALQAVQCTNNISFFKKGDQLVSELALLKEEDMPGLIILDFKTPGLSGIELVQHIKRVCTVSICTIAVYSTSLSAIQKEDLLMMGVDICLQKGKTLTEIETDMEQFCRLALLKRSSVKP